MSTISVVSLLQLELFGSSCLLVEISIWWSQRTNKIITDKAKKFYDFIKMRGEATAEDLMREFHILNEREFSRVIQKMLDEHQIIASEREGKILFSVNSTQKCHA
jgi:predicted HTH transcriptional regulator